MNSSKQIGKSKVKAFISGDPDGRHYNTIVPIGIQIGVLNMIVDYRYTFSKQSINVKMLQISAIYIKQPRIKCCVKNPDFMIILSVTV